VIEGDGLFLEFGLVLGELLYFLLEGFLLLMELCCEGLDFLEELNLFFLKGCFLFQILLL
jgi:hypothetical protein